MIAPLSLAFRMLNTPLLIRPDDAGPITSAIAASFGLAAAGDGLQAPPPSRLVQLHPGRVMRAGYDVAEGVAVIQVQGVLVQRLGTLRPSGGMTGYDGIRQNLLAALVDKAVRAIVLHIDSSGGEVGGCFDLADQIRAVRGVKPIWAILDESAHSAAYALASAAERVTVPRTGYAGSIGAIAMLADMSRALKRGGVAVHFVTYGARKAEEARATFNGVSPDLLARMQKEIDAVGEIFGATVRRNRGISAGLIRRHEGASFLGRAAVEQGLVDAVMAPDEAFRSLLASFGQRPPGKPAGKGAA